MKSFQRRAAGLFGLAMILLLPTTARGQYTRPGFGLQADTIVSQDSLDRAVEESRWTLGGLRVDPFAEIREISYNANVFGTSSNETSDLVVTVAAGLDFYLPVGPKTFLTAKVAPAYTWWRELEENRRLTGHYEAGAFGFYNRLQLELSGRRIEEVTYFSPEVLQRIPQTRDRARGVAELKLAGAVRLVGSANLYRYRQEDPALPEDSPGLGVSKLDRDATYYRAGFRYRPKESWYIGLGAQWEETEFVDPENNRGNEGTSPFLELRVTAQKVNFSFDLIFNDLEPTDGSDFQPFDEPTGRFRLDFTPKWRFTYYLYGSRTVVYSLSESLSNGEEDRIGVGLGVRATERVTLRGFYEVGDLTYTPIPGEIGRLPEDYRGYGLGLNYRPHDNISLRIGGRVSEYESALPDSKRSVVTIDSGVVFTFKRVKVTVR